MTFYPVHLTRSGQPLLGCGTLCGIELVHVVAVPLAAEQPSALDHPRLCPGCARVAEKEPAAGRIWEFGVAEGQEVRDYELRGILGMEGK